MSDFSVGGRAHQALAALSRGPTDLRSLRHVLGWPGRIGSRQRVFHLVENLKRAGVVCGRFDGLKITEAGELALMALEGGYPVHLEDAPRTYRRG